MSYEHEYKMRLSVQISAVSDPENTKKAISKLLYIRKDIAKAMLENTSGIPNKELAEMYKQINSDICSILGLVI